MSAFDLPTAALTYSDLVVETDPRAGQIVAVEGQPRRLFHVVGADVEVRS